MDLFKALLNEVPENIQKRFLIYIGMPAMWGNALRPVKIAHKSNVCASLSWCLNQWLRLFPKRHVRKVNVTSI